MAYADQLPPFQSGLCSGHLADISVLGVLLDILYAADRGEFADLVLLDLLVAFETVDHDILLQCLKNFRTMNSV
jgi:hypothetical protein